ncbi:uncharacterized protein MONBRDRAFT_33500 [Monosiga brevicollis MX1]|uniref:Vacuolar fusion protein MON1 homolog n=1 Tax=Monosiga brevicollis TaxID=81824 RepID=A9V5Q8_MONBE|nr:uncharacterized protein MONBRDRAFT_33500 [Monosiga brevicollis MX1]EDQ87083.1 predicted protein [Monosiga brevicollis MX1]|eukprot:XP_001748026.1 hypothetical protein [Monosiga brevicollis MX1]
MAQPAATKSDNGDELEEPLTTPGGTEASAMFAEDSQPLDDYDELHDLSIHHVGRGPQATEDVADEQAPSEAARLEASRQRLHLSSTEGTSSLGAAPAAASESSNAEAGHDVSWKDHDKHVFILSNAGKPIYTRHGHEEQHVTLMGVMSALVSFVENDRDELRWFRAGQQIFVFLQRGPLYLVMISRTGESHTHLAVQLTYVYNQILSSLTLTQLQRLFENKASFDLRDVLGGTEKFTDSLIDRMTDDPSFFLSAIKCLRMPQAHRDKIGGIINAQRCKELLFAVLVADNQLVTLVRNKRHSLPPQDLLLLMNMVAASGTFKEAENWMPICLPKFHSGGFLHAHVSYIDSESRTCLFLISTQAEAFYVLSEARATMLRMMSSQGCLDDIETALQRQDYEPCTPSTRACLNAHLPLCPNPAGYNTSFSPILNCWLATAVVGVPQLRHFIYKNKSTAQFTSPQLIGPYTMLKHARRLQRNYQHVHHFMHSGAVPLQIMYHAQSDEITLGWLTSSFELYASFDPLTAKPAAINAILMLIQWVKREEGSLFILRAQTF